MSEHTSAGIFYPSFSDLLDAAEEGFKAQLAEAEAEMEKDIARMESTQRTGWFWNRRFLTRDEAIHYLCNYGWWSNRTNFYRAEQRLARIGELRTYTTSEALCDVRLGQDDLNLLEPYMVPVEDK